MDCSPPGSSVHGIFQEEYWSGLLFPSPGDLPNPGIEPGSLALQADSLPSEPPGHPMILALFTCINLFNFPKKRRVVLLSTFLQMKKLNHRDVDLTKVTVSGDKREPRFKPGLSGIYCACS